MTNTDRHRRYRRRLKERAFTAIGFTCVFCGTRDGIEAAHISKTRLSGRNSRGLNHRYLDILKHPDCYRPMCRKHHRVFDSIMRCVKVEQVVEEPIPF